MARGSLAILLALLMLALAACGGDDGSDTATSIPDITIPEGEAETTTEPTGETTTAPGSGDFDASKPDSPENDIPPEPGTPEERFEKFCREHPQVCG